MKTTFRILSLSFFIFFMLLSCNNKEIDVTNSPANTSPTPSSNFRSSTHSTESFDFQVDEPYIFRSFNEDRTNAYQITLTLDANGTLSVSQIIDAVIASDEMRSVINAKGISNVDGDLITFEADINQNAWIIPFNGDEPSLLVGGGVAYTSKKCLCSKKNPFNIPPDDCSQFLVVRGGELSVECMGDPGCMGSCQWEKTTSVDLGPSIIISNPAIQELSVL